MTRAPTEMELRVLLEISEFHYCFDRSVTDEAWQAMIDAASPREE